MEEEEITEDNIENSKEESALPTPNTITPEVSNSPSKYNKQLPSQRHKRMVLNWLYTEPMRDEQQVVTPNKTLKKQFSKLENPFRQSQ